MHIGDGTTNKEITQSLLHYNTAVVRFCSIDAIVVFIMKRNELRLKALFSRDDIMQGHRCKLRTPGQFTV